MMDLRWRILVLVEVCVVLGSRTGEKSGKYMMRIERRMTHPGRGEEAGARAEI